MSEPKLKSCPWCGGKAELDTVFHKVSCKIEYGECAVIQTTWSYDTDEEAIEAWNRRSNDE